MSMRVLAGLLVAMSMFAADAPLMGNYAVWTMHRRGVPTEQIISAIHGSEPRFDLSPAEVAKLTSNGVPQTVIDAMSARQLAPRNEYMPTAREKRPPREGPNHWGMTPGMPEAALSGGVGMFLGSIRNVDLPDIVAGSVSLDGAIGVNRYVAGIGSITRHSRGGGSGCINADCFNLRASFTESLAGVRISGSNRSRVTPFVTGLLGGLRGSGEGVLNSNGVRDTAFVDAWTPALAVGGGVEFNGTRNGGFRVETRFLRVIDAGWFGRAGVGVFFRFGR